MKFTTYWGLTSSESDRSGDDTGSGIAPQSRDAGLHLPDCGPCPEPPWGENTYTSLLQRWNGPQGLGSKVAAHQAIQCAQNGRAQRVPWSVSQKPIELYSDTSLCLFPEITSESTQSVQCTCVRSRVKGVQRAEVPSYRVPQSAIESSLISICNFPTDPVSVSAIFLNSQA